MFIQQVKGNLKGGIEQFQKLYPYTLIVGRNGHGKSTIVNIVELLLGGFATDVMGRSLVRKPSDLIVLKGEGLPKSTLKLQGILSDGSPLSYELRETEKGAGKPKHLGPQGMTVRFPFQEVKENLVGSAENARKWLAQQLPIENYIEVSAELRELIYFHQENNRSATLVDVLEIIKEGAKRKVKDAKLAISSAEKAMDMLGKEVEIIDKSEVDALQTESDLLLNRIMAASKSVSNDEIDNILKEIKALEHGIESVLQEILLLGNVQPLSDVEKSEIAKLDHLKAVIEINSHREKCFVCDNHLDGRALTTQQVQGLLDRVADRVKQCRKKDELIAHREQGLKDLQRLKTKHGEMLERQAGFRHENKDQLQIQYTEIRRRYENAKQQYDAMNRIKRLKDTISSEEKVIEENKALAVHAEQQISEAIKQAIEVFCQRVSKYLPNDYRFIMDLGENHCRIGLHIFGNDCYAVSGAEWVMMILAIASATTSISDENGDIQTNVLNVFIPEERAYDAVTLSEMMNALSNAPGQVILTSTIKPIETSTEWEVIEVFKIPF